MNLFEIAGLLLGITCTLLAFFVSINQRTKLHRIWVFFNGAVAIWGFGCFIVGYASSESLALLGWKFAHVGGIFVGVFFFHMVCVFCNLERRKSIIAVYATGIFFLVMNILTDHLINRTRLVFGIYYNDATALFALLVGLWLFVVIWSFVELLKFYPKTKGLKRTQSLYMIWGFLIGFLGGTSTFFPEFRIDFLYPFGNFTIPIYCLISTYAIIRYRLMDIHLVIKKGMVYSLSAGILASLFVVFALTMTKHVENVTGLTSHATTIVAVLAIAVLFNPLKTNVQKIIDKTFYKRTYNYFDVIREVSRNLSTIFESGKINIFIANTVCDTLGLSSIYICAATLEGNYGTVYRKVNNRTEGQRPNGDDSGPELKNGSELIQRLIVERDILTKDELPAYEEKIGQDGIERIKGELEPFRGEAAAPVFIEGQLSLVLVLGEKLSGDMFTKEDANLLNTITAQTAIAVKNARLYKENLDSEKLASIGMMAATFAHEVRNPLTSLKTFAQLMPEKYNDEEFRDGFSKIVVGEIQKIDDLISDLLDFSMEKKSARIAEFDLVGIVDETIDYIKGKLGLARRNIVVEKKYVRESVMMVGDVKQLRQLFTNLITNGCQAMNSEGILRVEIHPDGDSVDVAITDTGKGIHPDDIQKIFDPFVTHKESGTGLGLPISKKIVEEHNGSLNVTSRLSEGSTFTVTLPVQKE